jgi:hypothetical protein
VTRKVVGVFVRFRTAYKDAPLNYTQETVVDGPFLGNGLLPDGSFSRKSGVLYHVVKGKKIEVKKCTRSTNRGITVVY